MIVESMNQLLSNGSMPASATMRSTIPDAALALRRRREAMGHFHQREVHHAVY